MVDTTTIANPADLDSSNGNRQSSLDDDSANSRQEVHLVWSIPGDFIYRQNGINIGKIFINGERFIPIPGRGIPLKSGDDLEFQGHGLNLFNSASFSTKSVLKNVNKSNDSFLSITVPDLSGLVKNGGVVTLSLKSQQPGAGRSISPLIVYSFKEDSQRKDTLAKEKHEAEEKAELAATAAGGFAVASVKQVPPKAGVGAKVGKNPLQSGGGTGAVNEMQDADDAEVLQEEQSSEPQSGITQKVLPKNFKQSAELVGEYIDKHSELIANNPVRSEVLSALASGNFEGLSKDGQEVLQRVVSSPIQGQTGLDAGQLTAALKIVREQIVISPERVLTQAKAGLQAQTQVSSANLQNIPGGETLSVSTSGKVISDVSGSISRQSGASQPTPKQTQVTVKASVETRKSGQASVAQPSEINATISGQEKVTAKPSEGQAVSEVIFKAKALSQSPQNGVSSAVPKVNISGKVSAGGQVSSQATPKAEAFSRQSLDIVGEQLSKNPELIFDNKIRGEVLEALGRGNLGGLNAEARVALRQTLKILGKGGSEKPKALENAAQNVATQLDQPEQASSLSQASKSETPMPEKVTGAEPESAKVAQGATPELKQPEPQTGNKDSVSTPAQPIPVVAVLNLEESKQIPDLQGQQPTVQPKAAKSPKLPEFPRPLKTLQGMAGRTARNALMGASLALGARDGNLEAAQRPQSKIEAVQPDEARPGVIARPEGLDSKIKLPDTSNARSEQEPEEQSDEEDEEEDFSEQQSAWQMAAVENQKLDASTKEITQKASKLLDVALMEGVETIWLSSLPTFGLSILIGAIAGDFLWMMKNSIVVRLVQPLLKTEALKKKVQEIARQIKISGLVKVNIAAFNAIVAAAILAVVFALLLIMIVGCNSPIGNNRLSGYRLTYIGFFIGDSCKAFDVSNYMTATGPASGPIAPRGP